jgi:hypothetical protein
MSESTRVNQSPNGMVASRENVSVSSSIEQVPDPEVLPKAKRRNFTQKEKLHILQLANECTQHGQVGALLRREGIYSSYLTTWKDQRDKGLLGTQKVGRPGGVRISVKVSTEIRRESTFCPGHTIRNVCTTKCRHTRACVAERSCDSGTTGTGRCGGKWLNCRVLRVYSRSAGQRVGPWIGMAVYLRSRPADPITDRQPKEQPSRKQIGGVFVRFVWSPLANAGSRLSLSSHSSMRKGRLH